jgi:predicted kinase
MRAVARHLRVGVELHYLEVPTEELWRRIEIRNSEPPWNNEPIARADLNEWLEIFEAPDASELALFDPPPDSRA